MSNKRSGYYAVARGRQAGVYTNWTECEANVKGFSGAKFKKFSSQNDAEEFVRTYAAPATSHMYSATPQATGNNFYCGVVELVDQTAHCDVSKRSFSSTTNYNLGKNLEESKRRREQGTMLIDSPPPRTSIKKYRVDSPNLKGIDSMNGRVSYLPFHVDSEGYVNVFTDGACLHNGRSNPKAGVGVWFGDDHPLNVSRPVDGPPTNNTAEIQAARLAIELANEAGFEKLKINTDSEFLINCITNWMHKWKYNGWKLAGGGDVKNRVELEKLDQAQQELDVKWNKVPAHSGLHGNEMADKLASAGALMN